VRRVVLAAQPSLICCKSGTEIIMQFVKLFQVSHRRYLQTIEVIFAGKIGDVTQEGSAPVIVFSYIAMDQQVAPPSERACTPFIA